MLDVFGHSRQQKGLELAATAKIEKKGGAFLVPSQSGKGRYTVIPHNETPHCSCPDHEEGGHKCKHLFAVEYMLFRELNADGTTTVTETVTVQKTVQRTYPQNWRAYNAAQTNEKQKFQELLRDLCSGIGEPPQTNGRPRLRLQDVLFSAAFKDGIGAAVHVRPAGSSGKGLYPEGPALQFDFQLSGKSGTHADLARANH